jgi:predicted transcriptional regulator
MSAARHRAHRTLAVPLAAPLNTALRALARAQRRSLHQVVEEALQTWLADQSRGEREPRPPAGRRPESV